MLTGVVSCSDSGARSGAAGSGTLLDGFISLGDYTELDSASTFLSPDLSLLIDLLIFASLDWRTGSKFCEIFEGLPIASSMTLEDLLPRTAEPRLFEAVSLFLSAL